jgi:hypothetical protein
MLIPTAPADKAYKIRRYGSALQGNKERLLRACNALALPDERRALLMAMAMIETLHLSPDERDKSKDKNPDKSANASIFNLSEDMLNQLGYHGDIHLLDPLTSLQAVVGLISKGIDKWGVSRMLNFVRGGRKGFDTGEAFGAADYRNAVATILKVIDMSPDLMSDDRRVAIYVPHK